jgi:hypothetical protein
MRSNGPVAQFRNHRSPFRVELTGSDQARAHGGQALMNGLDKAAEEGTLT